MLEGFEANLWVAGPAIVTAVDFSTMTLECQLAIKGKITDETGTVTYVNLPKLVDVPIVFPSAGGFTITFPIAVNDEVLVVFADRCIDGWWQLGGLNNPLEVRMHDLSDGFAIPGPKSVPNVVSAISTTGCQIRNNAGTSYVEIAGDGKIKLVSPSEIDVTGDIKVTGNISATGEITAHSAGTAIPLTSHLHTGVTSGGANTGAPIP